MKLIITDEEGLEMVSEKIEILFSNKKVANIKRIGYDKEIEIDLEDTHTPTDEELVEVLDVDNKEEEIPL